MTYGILTELGPVPDNAFEPLSDSELALWEDGGPQDPLKQGEFSFAAADEQIRAVLARTDTPSPVELGGLAWLAELDADDRAEALEEIRNAIVLTVSSEDPTPLREALHAWETTAAVMRDPKSRTVLAGQPEEDDFVEVSEPLASADD